VYYKNSNLGWDPSNDEGSIYFNYIQFAKKKGNNAKTYESVHQPTSSPSRPLLGCFRSPTPSPLKTNTSCTTTYNFPPSNDDCDHFSTEQVRQLPRPTSRPTRSTFWRKKLRRLFILAAIGSGLVLALGGLVLGIVIIGPLNYDSGERFPGD
jgi:hypothetical protein